MNVRTVRLRVRVCARALTLQRIVTMGIATTLLAMPAAAASLGGSPWENAVEVLMESITGPIARGLSLVAIVIGGLMFAFGEMGSKKMFSGIIFGVGMAVSAVNFYTWLFGR